MEKVNDTLQETRYQGILADPNAERYCFADQYEFILYAKHCKDAGKKAPVVWQNSDAYQKLFMQGYKQFDEGQYPQALSSYQAALRVNPVAIQSRFEICECYLKIGKLQDAKQTLLDMREYLVEACHVARFYRRMGFIAVEQKEYRLAAALFLFSMKYEKSIYASQELWYIEHITGKQVKISSPKSVIRAAGLPILEGYVFTDRKIS